MMIDRNGILARLLPLVLLGAVATPVAAQTSSASDCSYDTCALRLEDRKLRRGVAGDVVGKLGWMGGGTDVLLAGPDSAAQYARMFSRVQRRTWLAGVVAAVGLVAIRVVAWDDVSDGVLWAGTAAMPLTFYALDSVHTQERVAERAAHRSVWWYNRQFTVSDGTSPTVPMPPLGPRRHAPAPLILGGGGLGAAIGYAADSSPEGALIGSVIGSGLGSIVNAVIRRW